MNSSTGLNSSMAASEDHVPAITTTTQTAKQLQQSVTPSPGNNLLTVDADLMSVNLTTNHSGN